MKADIVVLIIKLFTHILLLFVEACIYIYLFDCVFFYVEFTDNFLNYALCVACIVTISTSIWNCISFGSMENKKLTVTNFAVVAANAAGCLPAAFQWCALCASCFSFVVFYS
jgi:hypothetical protein